MMYIKTFLMIGINLILVNMIKTPNILMILIKKLLVNLKMKLMVFQ